MKDIIVLLKIRRTPRSKRTEKHIPYTTLLRYPASSCSAVSTDQPLNLRPTSPHSSRRTTKTPSPTNGSNPPTKSSPPSNDRSEEHTSELQSLMRISYAVFCLNNKIFSITSSFLSHLFFLFFFFLFHFFYH